MTTYKARSRSVYLPRAAGWYDFWSGGAAVGGGQAIDVAAPYDSMPVHVRAGAIVPTGPEIPVHRREARRPDRALGLRRRRRRSRCTKTTAHLRLREGRGSAHPLPWNDATRTLTIGARQGSFTGMPASRTFSVVVVDAGHPAAAGGPAAAGRSTPYDGRAVSVRF